MSLRLLKIELEQAELQRSIHKQMEDSVSKMQRKHFLTEQLRQVQGPGFICWGKFLALQLVLVASQPTTLLDFSIPSFLSSCQMRGRRPVNSRKL